MKSYKVQNYKFYYKYTENANILYIIIPVVRSVLTRSNFVEESKFKHFKKVLYIQIVACKWTLIWLYFFRDIICHSLLKKQLLSCTYLYFHLKACKDGYYGINCRYTCPASYFGRRCILRCNCSIGQCHHVSGWMTSMGKYYSFNYIISLIFNDIFSRKWCDIFKNEW